MTQRSFGCCDIYRSRKESILLNTVNFIDADGCSPRLGHYAGLILTHVLRCRPAEELGEALAVVKGAQSRTDDGAEAVQPSSAASAAENVGARIPDGAASQRLPVGEDDAVSGASVLTGEPVHLYVMGDRCLRWPPAGCGSGVLCSADRPLCTRAVSAVYDCCLCPAGLLPAH